MILNVLKQWTYPHAAWPVEIHFNVDLGWLLVCLLEGYNCNLWAIIPIFLNLVVIFSSLSFYLLHQSGALLLLYLC